MVTVGRGLGSRARSFAFGFTAVVLAAACSSTGSSEERTSSTRSRLTTRTIAASADTFLKQGTPNQNQGSLPTLRLQASGKNRALVRFESSAVASLSDGGPASLRLTIVVNAENWGSSGRPISLHRLTKDWTEAGATWNCAIDANTANGSPDCSGETAWEMDKPSQPMLHPWVETPSAMATITNETSGIVTFDVTSDVALFRSGTPNYGWVLKKVDEGAAGRLEFASRETDTPPLLVGSCEDAEDAGVCDEPDAGADASSSADAAPSDAGGEPDAGAQSDASSEEDAGPACVPASCDDGSGDSCTVHECTSTGCVHSPRADGTACDDRNACTSTDQCSAGQCVGGALLDPSDGNPCTADACDPLTGISHTPLPIGTSCSDGNPCNGEEVCGVAGGCIPGIAPGLDDGNPCTVDLCDPALGIVHLPAAVGTSCADANACNGAETCDGAGACVAGTPPTTDDGNPCTADACDPTVGVTHTPLPAGDLACSNGDACDGVEACNGQGVCVPGRPPSLDDANPCTTDSCSPITGPVHVPIPTCDPTPTSGEAPFETRASVIGRVVSSAGGAVQGVTFTVYDQRATGTPRSDVIVQMGGDGSFRLRLTGFPEAEADRTPPHRLILLVDAPNKLRATREAYAHPGDAVDVGTIKLIERDPKITMIGPAGGVATDSRGLMEVAIPPGALSTTLPIQVTPLTSRDDFPAPLPVETITMYGVELEPSGTTFSTPATLRTTNYRNFPTNLTIPLGVFDPVEVHWVHEGVAVWNGTRFEVPITHFSTKDINSAQQFDLVARITQKPNPNKSDKKCGTGSSYRYGGGSIEQSLPLPSVHVRGEDIGLTLHYDSGLAGSLRLGTPPTNTSSAIPMTSLAVAVAGPKMETFCVPRGVDPPASSSPGQCSGVVGSCGPGAAMSVGANIEMLGLQNAAIEALEQKIRQFEIGGWMNLPQADGGKPAAPGYFPQTVSVKLSGGGGSCAGSGGSFAVSDPKAPRVQLATPNDGPWMVFPRKTLVHHRFSSSLGSGWGIQETSRVFRNGDTAAIVHGDGQQEDFLPRATATRLTVPFGPVAEHVYARDSTTGEIFVAYQPGTIGKMDPVTAAITPVLSGLSLNEFLFSMAITRVGSTRHFLIASTTRLVDIDETGFTRQLATRTNPFPGSVGTYGQASVAARGDLVFYTDGREDSRTVKRLRLTDPTPTLVDASAPTGDINLYPLAPLSGYQFENPHGLAFGIDGSLFVADPRRHVVYRVFPEAATGEIGPNSRVERALGHGSGTMIPATGERYPAAQFSINQPLRMTVAEDGVILVITDYGVTAFDPIAQEAETLFFDGSRDELSVEMTGNSAPHSFIALSRWSMFTRLLNQGPVRIDVEPLSSERDPTRTLRPTAGGGLELLDTTAGRVSRYDAAGRLAEDRRRTGELLFSVSYADARTMQVDRVTTAAGSQWVFHYNGDKIAAIVDPAGATTNFVVDERGDLTSMTLASGQLHAFSYDKHKMVSKTSPSGDVNTYTYAEDGTASSAVKSTGETHTFTPVLAQKPTYTTDGTLVYAGSYVDSHGVAHDVVMNAFGDIEKDTYTADGVSYDRRLVYAGDLFLNVADATNAIPRKNVMLRSATTTLNGVPLFPPFRYDVMARPVSQVGSTGSTRPGGALRNWRYDANGWLRSFWESPANSYPYNFERDPAGHVLRVYQGGTSASAARESTFTWRPDGQLATGTTHGVTTTYSYDEVAGSTGNVLFSVDTVGRTASFQYDDRGNVIKAGDGTTITELDYDETNRLRESRDALSNSTTFRYTRTSCGCSERDLVTGVHTPDLPAGLEWGFDYGPDGRVSRVTDPNGFFETYTYKPTGELETVTDRKERTTTFQHDQVGRLVSLIDTASRKHRRAYTAPTSGVWSGPTLTAGSPDGTAATGSLTDGLREGEYQVGLNGFDLDGYPARVSLYRDATFALGYYSSFDDAKRPLVQRDRSTVSFDSTTSPGSAPFRTLSYGWNIQTTEPLATGISWATATGAERMERQYNGNLDMDWDSTVLASGQADTVFTRDVAGRPTVARRNFNVGAMPRISSGYSYRPDGRLSEVTNPDGRHEFTYDVRGLLATQTIVQLPDPGAPPGTLPINEGTYTYGYDAMGRNARLEYPDGHVRLQTYDDVGRLKSRCYEYGTETRCYSASYDGVGNPVRLVDPEGVDVVEYDALDRVRKVTREVNGVAVEVETYEYNALGALKMNASVAVDAKRPRLDGAGVADLAIAATLGAQPVVLDNGGSVTSLRGTQFTWTRAGDLRSITPPSPGTPITYRTDGQQRRLGRSGPSTTLYVNEGPHRVAVVNINAATLERYLFDGIDHPLRTKGATTAYYEVDLAGNVRRLRAAGGVDLGGYRYTAFGQTLEDTATFNQPLRWKGRPLEVVGGVEIYDMRARQWVPELGAFLTIDEYAFHDAKSTLWGWPAQNPFSYADPAGRSGIPVPLLFAGVVLAAAYYALASPTHDGSVVHGATIMAAPAVGGALGEAAAALTLPAISAVEAGVGGKVVNDAAERARTPAEKSLDSLASRLAEHQAKLNAYRANPDALDNKGLLRNAPTQEIRDQIIQRRIQILERDIKHFETQIEKVKNSCE